MYGAPKVLSLVFSSSKYQQLSGQLATSAVYKNLPNAVREVTGPAPLNSMKFSETQLATKPIVNHSIKAFNTLKYFLTPKDDSKFVAAVYSYSHAYVATSILLDKQRYACVHPRYQERWQKRADTLWWSCTARWVPERDKRTIRSWNARRGRIAFTNSLRRQGFGHDGKRLEGCRYGFDLYGTLQLSSQPGMIQTRFGEVEKKMDWIVERLIGLQQQKGRLGQKNGGKGGGKMKQG